MGGVLLKMELFCGVVIKPNNFWLFSTEESIELPEFGCHILSKSGLSSYYNMNKIYNLQLTEEKNVDNYL